MAGVLLSGLAIVGRAGVAHADFPLPDVPLVRSNLGAEYRFDFGGGRYDQRSLRIEGSGVQVSLIKPGRDGLRVAIPRGPGGKGLSLCTKFGLGGDFEVMASYEVIRAPQPKPGARVGVEVALQSAARWEERVYLSRELDPRGGEAQLWGGIEGGEDPPRIEPPVATGSAARRGRFHLARVGPIVYLHAAEEGKAFRKVFEGNFGTSNLMFLRMQTRYEGADQGFEMSWKEVTIRAESLPTDPGRPGSGSSRPPTWLIVAGCAGILIAIAGWSIARGHGPANRHHKA